MSGRKIASREVVRDLANFRDHGRTVDRPLLALLCRLQQRNGRAWASEGGLRRMLAEDTGHCPGVTTLAKALVRLAKQGLVVHVWLHRGQIMPDGGVCSYGTRLVYVPKGRRERRAAAVFSAQQNRRAGYETRMTGHRAKELLAKITRPLPSPPPGDPFAAERARQLAAAREWSAKNEERPEVKPPDN